MSMPPPNRDNAKAQYVHPDKWSYSGVLQAGSFTIEEDDGDRYLICVLPGGHFGTCPLKPEAEKSPSWTFNERLDRPTLHPSWTFNERLDRPTLHPSIHCQSSREGQPFTLWHGWLRDGEFVSC